MENPAVTVTVTVVRPDVSHEFWSDTAEGYASTLIVLATLESYFPNIEITSNDVDPLTRVMTISYSTNEIYEQSRIACLEAEPDFITNRNAYYDSIGGSVSQTVLTS